MRRLALTLGIASAAAVALSWAQADDQQIARLITERLKHEQLAGHLRGFDIDLKVANGKVLLKGRVSSADQQALAEKVAREINGVTEVINDLDITVPAAAAPAAESSADNVLAKKIAEQLATLKKSGELKSFNIQLDVKDGAVTLVGHVASKDQQQLALKTAQATPNVKRVINKLTIREAAEEIPTATTAAEAKAPTATETTASEPAPAAETTAAPQRKPLLPGLLASAGLKRDSAWQPETETVAEVAKETAAEKTSAPASEPAQPSQAELDAKIAAEISSELNKQKAQGNLKQFDIQLSVNDGVVVLNGRVTDQDQLRLATDIASRVEGVRNLENLLLVVEVPQQPRLPLAIASTPVPPQSQTISPPVTSQPEPVVESAQHQLVNHEQSVLQARRPVATAEYHGEQSAVAPSAAQAFQPQDLTNSDKLLGERVMDRLRQAKDEGELRGFGIGVNVQGGKVWLKGRVANADQAQSALQIVQRIPGVQLVVNDLKIDSDATAGTKADSMEIAKAIDEALQAEERKGTLQGSNLNVQVKGDQVVLRGEVASEEQKALALEAARVVPGVKQVVDGLRVNAPFARTAGLTPQAAALARAATVSTATPTRNPAAGSARTPIIAAQPSASLIAAGNQLQANGQQPAVAAVPQIAKTNRPAPIQLETEQTVETTLPVTAETLDQEIAWAQAPQAISQAMPLAPQAVPYAAMPYGPAPGGAYLVQMPYGAPGYGAPGYGAPGYQVAYVMQEAAPVDQTPRPLTPVHMAAYAGAAAVAAPFMAIGQMGGAPAQLPGAGSAVVPARYDHPSMPGYAWPSYAAYPNYAGLTYPKQYSPSAWPYIGPFYPYPQVPLGWRKVTLKWNDGWWMLDFKAK